MLSSKFSRVFLALLASLVVAVPVFAAPKPPTGPKITNCNPNSGPIIGGTTVLVNGSGFVSGATVTFGGVAAQSTAFVNSTQLSTVTPALGAGAVAVKVTNPNGTSFTLSAGFTFVAPASNVLCTWANTADGAHPVISGEATTLRGTVKSTSTTLTFTWNFDDGSAEESGSVTDPYAIEATHTYTAPALTTFNATLTVKDGATLVGTDTYKIAVAADTLANRKQIAIEKGLWYAHKSTRRDNAPPEHGGMSRGYISNSSDQYNNWDVPLNTMVTGTGFLENGFKANGAADNPYTEDVQRYVNYVTERLVITPIANKGDGSNTYPIRNPEGRTGTMIDGLGIHFNPESETEYEFGMALRFLANCGLTTQKAVTYDDSLNRSGNPAKSVKNWTMIEIVQQMIDFFAWAQVYDVGNDYDNWGYTYDEATYSYNYFTKPVTKTTMPVPANRRGSWPYFSEGWTRSWIPETGEWSSYRGTYGDTALAYWVVTGLRYAQKQGCVWPDFVKTELDAFLKQNQDRVTGSPFYGEFHFGEAYGHHLVERAGEALVLLKWVGRKNSDAQVVAAKNFINTFWTRHNYEHQQNYPRSERGDNQCTNDDGTREDCFTHFSLTRTNEAGHYSPIWDCQLECLGEMVCQAGDICNWNFRDEPAGSNENWNYYYDCYSDPCATQACNNIGSDCVEGTRYISGWDWVLDANYNQYNAFGMLAVSEGLASVGVTTGFPTTDTMGWQERYLRIMIDNQLPSGMWNDKGWIWDSDFGTGWALMLLPNL